MVFFSNAFSATIKTALTPLAVAKDAVNVVTGNEPNTTKELLESARNDASDAFDDLGDANI